ncbi:MAG: microcystin-dependent protein [Oceanicoccus sp.]|jgi:microcystin-dependent protein
MSDPFIAEVRMMACNFAPRGWAFCNGQLLPISENTALFSLIGTIYGGDGRTTFGLPDLQNRSPMHPGQGPGLPSRRLGEVVESQARTDSVITAVTVDRDLAHAETSQQVSVYPVLQNSRGNAPSLGMNFVIALNGEYPSRS